MLRGLINCPRYGPLPLNDPQEHVTVRFEGWGEPLDVTRNNVVAALRPFTIGIMFDAAAAPATDTGPRLSMYETAGFRRLGFIDLRPVRTIPIGRHHFCLFEAPHCENQCVPALKLRLYDLREQWRLERRNRKNPYNFRMSIPDLRASWVFYICPRPVILVTVEHKQAGNMFPMDLVGPTDSPWFSMALRSTSPAVDLMRKSRRMALAGVPYEYREFAYELGKHHRKTSIEWSTLPFAVKSSPAFGLPIAVRALRVREVQVEEVYDVGSHTLFLTSIVRDTGRIPGTGRQLFHTFQSGRAFRKMEESAEGNPAGSAEPSLP